MNILIAGSSGIIGSGLTSNLFTYGNVYGLNRVSRPNDVDVVLDFNKPRGFKNFPYKDVYFDALIFLVSSYHSKVLRVRKYYTMRLISYHSQIC